VARASRTSSGRAGAIAGVAAVALLAFPGVASATVTSSVSGGVLRASSDAADGITIECVGGQVRVNGGNPGTGAASCADITSIDVDGGPGDNALNLAGVTNDSFGRVTSVSIDGGGGNDTLTGSERADALNGGDGNDRLVGDDNPAGTRDGFQGQGGDDTLVWNPGDDDDQMEGGDGTDTIEVNGGGGPEVFEVKPSTTAGRVQFDRTGPDPPGPFNLDIGTSERLDFNAGGGDDSMTAGEGLTALGFALDLDGGDGNDTLDGGDGPDLMTGGEGNDRLIGDNNATGTRDVAQGQGGDDTLVWNPGDGDDTNEGGDGVDTIEVNGGGGGEVFEVKPSATAGRVQFDRTGPDPPGPFTIDIGTSERLDFNAGGGDDSMTAGEGLAALGFALDLDGGDANDTLDGGDGADLITGGEGNDRLIGDDNPAGTRDVSQGGGGDDTLVWNPGDGDDTNEGGDGTDVIEVNGGGGGEVFEVKPSATAGRVQFDRTGPDPPGPFNLDIGTSEVLQLNANDGNDRIRGADGLAALITSVFDGGGGNDRILGTDGEDVLSGGDGFDVIRSVDEAEDQVECGDGFDIALVDDRDLVRGCDFVLGGLLRVRLVNRVVDASGGEAALRLRCVATRRCTGTVRLRRGSGSLGAARFAIGRRNVRVVEVDLNRRGRRLVARAPRRGLRVRAVIVARDARGNGWRTVTPIRLRG
jgi:Ca2+-binding RTX toxin-like protein